MKALSIVEVKSHFSALLAEVTRGEEIAITRHGRIVARLVPEKPRVAGDAFRSFWNEATRAEIDLEAPLDAPPEPVTGME